MKILQVHNFYQQPGGEDQVFRAEGQLLEAYGHEVVRFTRHNDALAEMGRVTAARKTIYNRDVYRELRELICRQRPDVMHCTNLFPLISPAAYDAARDEGVPVVQSLHNYRLLCPGANFVRAGRTCEKCLGSRTFWPGVVHGCYRGSRSASLVVSGMLAAHWARGTWTNRVDRSIALSEFSRRKFIEGGLPAEKISVKPNFLPDDPGPGDGSGDYAVFVGRLSAEKGIETLLSAWELLESRIPLCVVGDGPLKDPVRAAAACDGSIRILGRRDHADVLDLIGRARLLVFPSTCYETFGLTIVEAFAKGTPVVASRHGAAAELVEDGRTGAAFTPGDAADLARQVRQLWDTDLAPLRTAARDEFESHYTAARNYELLMAVYESVGQATRLPVHQRMQSAK